MAEKIETLSSPGQIHPALKSLVNNIQESIEGDYGIKGEYSVKASQCLYPEVTTSHLERKLKERGENYHGIFTYDLLPVGSLSDRVIYANLNPIIVIPKDIQAEIQGISHVSGLMNPNLRFDDFSVPVEEVSHLVYTQYQVTEHRFYPDNSFAEGVALMDLYQIAKNYYDISGLRDLSSPKKMFLLGFIQQRRQEMEEHKFKNQDYMSAGNAMDGFVRSVIIRDLTEDRGLGEFREFYLLAFPEQCDFLTRFYKNKYKESGDKKCRKAIKAVEYIAKKK